MKLPSEFIERTKPLLVDEWDNFLIALNESSPTSIRINIDKVDRTASSSVPWASNGFYLAQRPQFTFDPLFHAGCYYVQ